MARHNTLVTLVEEQGYRIGGWIWSIAQQSLEEGQRLAVVVDGRYVVVTETEDHYNRLRGDGRNTVYIVSKELAHRIR